MKQTIYETSGRAKEYSSLALNLFSSCDHGCRYCYAPLALHKDKTVFYKGSQPRVSVDDIEYGAKTFLHSLHKNDRVLLCFTCDPYQLSEAKTQITRDTIKILHNYGINVTILTKGGKRSMRDFDLLTPKDAYATTLTLCDNEASLRWEPNAALPSERIEALKEAKRLGIETWVSFEPVIYPYDTMQLLELSKDFTGHYKIGTLNYHPEGKLTDWQLFGREIKKRLDDYGLKYYFKKDLLTHMGVNPETFKQTFICD